MELSHLWESLSAARLLDDGLDKSADLFIGENDRKEGLRRGFCDWGIVRDRGSPLYVTRIGWFAYLYLHDEKCRVRWGDDVCLLDRYVYLAHFYRYILRCCEVITKAWKLDGLGKEGIGGSLIRYWGILLNGSRRITLMRWIVPLLILMQPVYGYALDVGDAAPDFDGVSLDNKQISFYSRFVGEKPVYLIFWATW